MKPTLSAFLLTFSLTAILSACTQEEETAGMGETTDTETTQTTEIEPEVRDDTEETGQFGGTQGGAASETETSQETTFGGEQESGEMARDSQEEVDLPEEAPAAGGEQSGQQSQEAETGTGADTGTSTGIEPDTESQAEEPESQQ